jgi:hypothetical protein
VYQGNVFSSEKRIKQEQNRENERRDKSEIKMGKKEDRDKAVNAKR